MGCSWVRGGGSDGTMNSFKNHSINSCSFHGDIGGADIVGCGVEEEEEEKCWASDMNVTGFRVEKDMNVTGISN